MNNDCLLDVYRLKKYFTISGDHFFEKNVVKAVDDVSFSIKKGETLGLVGESGCGKTTTGRALLRLVEPTSGRITFDGDVLFDSGGLPLSDNKEDQSRDTDGAPVLSAAKYAKMLPFRRRMQIVFQDPYSSLDPRMTVGDIVGEGIDIHNLAESKKDRRNRIVELLEQVGLNTEHANRYPHEFSGGQRQRVGIARALAVNPELIVCDEPVSALDVSIQAQVINMLEDLQSKIGLTYLFIAHDLSVVKHISNRIGVMYLGKLVELADNMELVFRSQHPYSKSLISAIPIADPKKSRESQRTILQGDVPSPVNPPSGCRFRTRCAHASTLCSEQEPEFREIAPGHYAACHII
jgi:oligopeptide transport system ATP-binding protein